VPSLDQRVRVVSIEARGPGLVHALALALDDCATRERAPSSAAAKLGIVPNGEVTPRNAFALLAVARVLGLDSVRRLAVDVLVEHATPRTALRSARAALSASLEVREPALLQAAYECVKAVGLSRRRAGGACVFECDAAGVLRYRESKTPPTGALATPGHACPARAFRALAAAERAVKDPFFVATTTGDEASEPADANTTRADEKHDDVADDDDPRFEDQGGAPGRSARTRRRPPPPRCGRRSASSTPPSSAEDRDDDAETAAELAGVCDDTASAPPPPKKSPPPVLLKGDEDVQPTSVAFAPGMRRCYLVRRKAVARAVDGVPGTRDDEFCLYDDATLQLLCCARGRKHGATFEMALARCADDEPFYAAQAPEFLARSTATLSGSRFVLRDWGLDDLPGGGDDAAGVAGCLPARRVRGAVTYAYNVLGREPNSMRVAVVDHGGAGDPRVHRFRTRPAKWNARLQMWTLDFQTRVKLASKKNFQLLDVADDDHAHASSPSPRAPAAHVKLLFGKCSKNRFALDFAPPFAPATALFVALTTFASKLVAA